MNLIDIRHAGILAQHATKRYRQRKIDDIGGIVAHHSGTLTGTAQAFASYHVNELGWPGIGYHYVIDKRGDIYYCNSIDVRTYHVSRNNTKLLGICLVGDFDIEYPTAEQYESLECLIQNLRYTLGLTVPVVFHKDYGNTDCPGKNFDVNRFKNL